MRNKRDEFNFGLLFITIALGVATGNLISNWVTAKVVEYQARLAADDLRKELQRQSQAISEETKRSIELNAAQTAARQEALRKERAADPTGQKLARACDEWRKADNELKSYTTRTEASKSCSHYESYLNTGHP